MLNLPGEWTLVEEMAHWLCYLVAQVASWIVLLSEPFQAINSPVAVKIGQPIEEFYIRWRPKLPEELALQDVAVDFRNEFSSSTLRSSGIHGGMIWYRSSLTIFSFSLAWSGITRSLTMFSFSLFATQVIHIFCGMHLQGASYIFQKVIWRILFHRYTMQNFTPLLWGKCSFCVSTGVAL
jgi:hypothetical protein